jgi:hypothetical protein
VGLRSPVPAEGGEEVDLAWVLHILVSQIGLVHLVPYRLDSTAILKLHAERVRERTWLILVVEWSLSTRANAARVRKVGRVATRVDSEIVFCNASV